MSSNPVAVRAEGLGKKYRIGSMQEYVTIRETMMRAVQAPFRWIRGARGEESRHIWALSDVSFEFRQGEVVGIVGPNGAGKSTLLKVLARVTEPTTGRAEVRGRVGSLLEVGTGFHPELSGRENIYLNGAILGMRKAEIDHRFDDIVGFAELGKFIDTPVKHYSSGMYMRLAFSVAAHLETEILLVDEVLAVGDGAFQRKCLNHMNQVGGSGKLVLFVSHNLGAIRRLCQKCLWLDQGKVKALGPSDEVIAEYQAVFEDRRAKVAITPERRNRGGEKAQFLSAMLMDDKGTLKNDFMIGEGIVLDIDVECFHEIPHASFWIMILDAEGVPIISSFQKDSTTVRLEPGKFRLRCDLEGLRMLTGSYTISAGVMEHESRMLSENVHVEWIDTCQSFQVLPLFADGEPFDYRLGRVDHRVKWSMKPQINS